MVRRHQASILLVALLVAACASRPAPLDRPRPRGPARVRPEVVARHAAQFEREVPQRSAGTQQEEIAATYILGHLQEAGYAARLDGVPVANLVRSTNVIALPPGGGPSAVVVTPYDTAPGAPGDAEAIGLLLETARALYAADRTHSVEFVALGAEHADVSGGRLGSRRLARLLLDEDQDPVAVTIRGVTRSDDVVRVAGHGARSLLRRARRMHVDAFRAPAPDPDVFAAAGFRSVFVGGGVRPLGRVLLAWLAG